MKVLHVFSNWKWTGPAEPALNLAEALRERGHEVLFACGCDRDGRSIVAEHARGRMVPLLEGLRLNKHRKIISDAADARQMALWLRKNPVDVIHAHMDNDHAIAARASRHADAPLVRSLYAGDADSITPRGRRLISNSCDALLALSRTMADAAPEIFGLPRGRIRHIEGAIDTERFSPRKRDEAAMRTLGLSADDFVVGIVARLQRHRRFDIFFEAVRQAARTLPRLKALVIGRGTHAREIGHDFAERLGIGERVVFAGYHGADYVDVANCMDVKVFLVPGSDGSCRAVRECMALGKPVIAARRGILPEIVEDGLTGVVIDDTAENLAGAMTRLGRDAELRERMGMAAAEKARERFALSKQAEAVEELYRFLLNPGGPS